MQNSHFVLGQIAFPFLNRKGPPNFYCNNFWQNIQFSREEQQMHTGGKGMGGEGDIIMCYDKYKKH